MSPDDEVFDTIRDTVDEGRAEAGKGMLYKFIKGKPWSVIAITE